MATRILVVDDDAKVRLLLADMLNVAGYEVILSPDGESALSLLQHDRFDIVLTDIRMRGVSGLQVLNAVKDCQREPAVVLLTGYGSLDTAIAALRAGAADYLLKPCGSSELLECMANIVQRRRVEQQRDELIQRLARGFQQLQALESSAPVAAGTRSDVLSELENRYMEIGALRIDCFRHSASFGGQPLHLTPTEYAIMHCLAETPGRVWEYRHIVRRTHGHHVDDTDAQTLLKPHVHKLRRKIDPAYLVSVRGTGYMLVDPHET